MTTDKQRAAQAKRNERANELARHGFPKRLARGDVRDGEVSYRELKKAGKLDPVSPKVTKNSRKKETEPKSPKKTKPTERLGKLDIPAISPYQFTSIKKGEEGYSPTKRQYRNTETGEIITRYRYEQYTEPYRIRYKRQQAVVSRAGIESIELKSKFSLSDQSELETKLSEHKLTAKEVALIVGVPESQVVKSFDRNNVDLSTAHYTTNGQLRVVTHSGQLRTVVVLKDKEGHSKVNLFSNAGLVNFLSDQEGGVIDTEAYPEAEDFAVNTYF